MSDIERLTVVIGLGFVGVSATIAATFSPGGPYPLVQVIGTGAPGLAYLLTLLIDEVAGPEVTEA